MPVTLALLVLLLTACGSGQDEAEGQQEARQPPPRPAQVLTVERRNLELDKSYPALLRSVQAVTLTARVTGVLQERHYEEGAQVQQGQVLFTIEPARHQAAVRQRQADLQSAQAEFNRVQRNWERYQRLYGQNLVSEQERDEARAALETAEAAVAQAEAALDNARIDLDYTTVEAPVAGQISLSEVNVGNLVQPPQALATITPIETVEARFSLPVEDAAALRYQRSRPDAPEVVAVVDAPDEVSPYQDEGLRGQIGFLGASVDEATGTVQAEAVFDNSEGRYLPGQFVRVSLQGLQRFQVIPVPAAAVTEGLKGPRVFVLDEDNVATSRFVSLGEQAGAWQIISDNLEPGEEVIVTAVGSISAGDRIEPQPFDGDPEVVGQEEPPGEVQGDGGESADSAPRQNEQGRATP